MSSTEVAEYLVPEVLERPAVEQDVGDSLSSLPALAAGASNPWNSLGEEKVAQAYFLTAQLHQQRALSFSKAFVDLKYFLGRLRCVSVGCSFFGLCSPLGCPCSLYLSPAPASDG